MNTKRLQKLSLYLRVFTVFVLLTSVLGCDLSDIFNSGDNVANLQAVERDKPNLSEESSKIDIDPDSDDLVEEKNYPNSVNNTTPSPTADDVSADNNENNESNAEQNDNVSNSNIAITHNSFGKVKIGMNIAEASQALGIELVAPNGKGEECYYVEPKQGFKGIDFMVIDGVIARIDIESKEFSTDKGARIGDTEAKIKSLYKGIEVHPQKYDEKLHDMEIYSDDKKHLIIFETDGKVVTGFRVGRAEEVSWVERCG